MKLSGNHMLRIRTLVDYNHICDQICQKGSYTRTVSRHTFHRQLLATVYINAPTGYVFTTAES